MRGYNFGYKSNQNGVDTILGTRTIKGEAGAILYITADVTKKEQF